MMQFKTAFDPHGRIFANPGNRKRQKYRTRYNDIGQLELVPNGQDDIYDMIQSHAESVDIDTILSKFVAGDPDALAKTQGTFGDFTNLPTSYAEMLNVINESEQFLNSCLLKFVSGLISILASLSRLWILKSSLVKWAGLS